MKKKLLTLATAGTILLFANKGFSQEITDVLKTKTTFPQIEQLDKEISDTLNYKQINKQKYQEQKNKMIKNGDKESFKKLIEEYLSNIEKEIIQNPELRKRELEMLYFDCEFADISTPHKLKNLLNLSGSYVID